MISDPELVRPTIEWTRPKLKKFRQEFFKAMIQNGGDTDKTFSFEDHEWVIGYAAYLIQYLDERLK